jgi:hypothetical protein
MVRRMTRHTILASSLAPAVLASACFSSSPALTVDASGDDAAADAGSPLDSGAAPDSTIEASAEAGIEAGVEGEAAAAFEGGDATEEASVDASLPDAVAEAGPDATLEASADAAADAAPDARADAAPDASFESIAALTFSGSDWVHLPEMPGAASETAFSVELWFQSTSNVGSMFEVYSTGGGADRFLSLNAGSVCFYVYAAGAVQICTDATTYGDGAWHHAAGTLGTGGMRLYVDGALANSNTTTTSSSFSGDTDLRLGNGHTGFVSTLVYLQGALDEVRVWTVERSASDISANYRQEIDPATAGLQGYWRLDGSGSTSTATDSTSNGNDGTLMSYTFSPSPWVTPGAF